MCEFITVYCSEQQIDNGKLLVETVFFFQLLSHQKHCTDFSKCTLEKLANIYRVKTILFKRLIRGIQQSIILDNNLFSNSK